MERLWQYKASECIYVHKISIKMHSFIVDSKLDVQTIGTRFSNDLVMRGTAEHAYIIGDHVLHCSPITRFASFYHFAELLFFRIFP